MAAGPNMMAAGFNADEWRTLSSQELVRRCRDLSAEARGLAAAAGPEEREAYLRAASEWLKLADEIEQYRDQERGSSEAQER